MLALDSLVIDLIFQADAEIDADAMIEAMGGPDITSQRQIIDVDLQDPRFELEISPSLPFRRRGERRLLMVDVPEHGRFISSELESARSVVELVQRP